MLGPDDTEVVVITESMLENMVADKVSVADFAVRKADVVLHSTAKLAPRVYRPVCFDTKSGVIFGLRFLA